MLLTTDLPDAMYPLLGIFLAFFFIYNIVDAGTESQTTYGSDTDSSPLV